MSENWIAVDWGTSALRVWAMRGREVLDHARSDQGMGGLAPADFEPALLELIEPWLSDTKVKVIACGMVGARQGWIEAAYSPVPCPALSAHMTKAPSLDPRLDMWIAPGLSQAAPSDVMRGEETQIAGYLAQTPDFDGVLCLPGTHTKWVHISAGEVVSFRTFMSGELFALLGTQSVLKHSVGDDFDEAAFTKAIDDTLSRPERLAADLFGIRAASLLTDQSQAVATARLSGLLIGAELAAARPYWLGQDVALIGAPALTKLYKMALAQQGLTAPQADASTLTLAGLTALYEKGL